MDSSAHWQPVVFDREFAGDRRTIDSLLRFGLVNDASTGEV